MRRRLMNEDLFPEAAAELRGFVESLGHRIAERINWAIVANATPVAACVLLGEGHRGGQHRPDDFQGVAAVHEFHRIAA